MTLISYHHPPPSTQTIGKRPFPYETVVRDPGPFKVITEETLAEGIGRRPQIDESPSALFPARELVAFGVSWMEQHFE